MTCYKDVRHQQSSRPHLNTIVSWNLVYEKGMAYTEVLDWSHYAQTLRLGAQYMLSHSNHCQHILATGKSLLSL